MEYRVSRVAFAVAVFLGSPPGSSAQTGCSAAVRDLQAETRALHREAQEIGGAFLIYDGLDVAADAALGAYGKQLDALGKSKTDPLAPATKLLLDAKERHQTLSDWEERLKRWGQGITGYKNCAKNPDCSFLDWMKENEIINKELADWLKSLGDGGFEKATERVERASELLKNYTAKVGNAATGAMKTALDCLRVDVAKAQTAADQEATRTANAAAPPKPGHTATTPTVQKGGGGAGKVLAGLIVVGGVAAGAAIASSKSTESAASSGSSGGSSSGMTFVGATIICTSNGTIYNRCDGDATVTVRNSVPANTSLRLAGGGGSWFGVNATTTSALPGTIAFRFSGIPGPGTQTCPSPITSLVLIANASQNTLATLGGITIPINCR